MHNLITEESEVTTERTGELSRIIENRKKFGIPVLRVPSDWLFAPTPLQEKILKYYESQMELVARGEKEYFILPSDSEISLEWISPKEPSNAQATK